jgi:hypothetical protein
LDHAACPSARSCSIDRIKVGVFIEALGQPADGIDRGEDAAGAEIEEMRAAADRIRFGAIGMRASAKPQRPPRSKSRAQWRAKRSTPSGSPPSSSRIHNVEGP